MLSTSCLPPHVKCLMSSSSYSSYQALHVKVLVSRLCQAYHVKHRSSTPSRQARCVQLITAENIIQVYFRNTPKHNHHHPTLYTTHTQLYHITRQSILNYPVILILEKNVRQTFIIRGLVETKVVDRLQVLHNCVIEQVQNVLVVSIALFVDDRFAAFLYVMYMTSSCLSLKTIQYNINLFWPYVGVVYICNSSIHG